MKSVMVGDNRTLQDVSSAERNNKIKFYLMVSRVGSRVAASRQAAVGRRQWAHVRAMNVCRVRAAGGAAAAGVDTRGAGRQSKRARSRAPACTARTAPRAPCRAARHRLPRRARAARHRACRAGSTRSPGATASRPGARPACLHSATAGPPPDTDRATGFRGTPTNRYSRHIIYSLL